MKNTQLLSLGALLSAGFLLTACSNDDGVSDDSPVESTWTLTVKATKGGNEATTRVLKPGETGDKTLYATWATTENVYVYYEKDEGNHGVLHPTANSEEATLTGNPEEATLTGNLTGFADRFIEDQISSGGFYITLQFPREGQISYDRQNGTLEHISSDYDWATATVKVTAAKLVDNKNKILTAEYANFENQQAIVKFTLKDNAGNSLNASSLKIAATGLIEYGEHQDDVVISPVEPTNVIWAALRGINGTVTLTATTVDEVTYTYTTKEPKTFTNGKYYDITVKMTQKQ